MSIRKKKRLNRIRQLLLRGKVDDALELTELGDTEFLLSFGTRFFRMRTYDAAEKTFGRIVRLNPGLAIAWDNRGACLVRLGRYEDALKAFDRALEIDPTLAEAWYNKGVVLSKLGKHEETIKVCD